MSGAYSFAERDGVRVLAVGKGLSSAASPAELVLSAYSAGQHELQRHLEAECAFVLWDDRAGEVLLGRDTTGTWPLFASVVGGTLHFASSIRLLSQSGIPMHIVETQVAAWLSLYPMDRQRTLFDGVVNLTPGTLYAWRRGELVKRWEWRPDRLPEVRLRDRREYAEGLRETLRAAIAARLPGTGPAAASLSGGLDSTSVISLAASGLAAAGREIHCFTSYPEMEVQGGLFVDERQHAAAVASRYPNIRHHFLPTSPQRIFEVIDGLNSHQGEPVINPSSMAWFCQIGRRTKELGLDAFLVGSMGNVTISRLGTQAVRSYATQRRLLKALTVGASQTHTGLLPIRQGLAQFLGPLLPAQLTTRLRGGRHAAQKLSLIEPGFAAQHGVSAAQNAHAMRRCTHRERLLRRYLYSDSGIVAGAMRCLTGAGFTDPTADRRVVEFCWSIPEEEFAVGGVERGLIRAAMRQHLPALVLEEQRRGYQGADIVQFFEAERSNILAEIQAMRDVEPLPRALNLSSIADTLSNDTQFRSMPTAYWFKLVRVLAVGRFLRSHADGRLFA